MAAIRLAKDCLASPRRAARVALAIKINDVNALQWTAYQERHDRWLKRQQNEKPRPFVVRFADVQGDALMERIDTHLGILSDASVHFTPEFYSNLDWEDRSMAVLFAAYQRCVSMKRGSVSASNCARVFSAMPMRHGTTRSGADRVDGPGDRNRSR